MSLARVYRGSIEADLRERVMVAVSEANACSGCTRVHQRWALRTGVSDQELEALGLGDLARLDERSRAAVVYAVDRSQARFAGEPPPEIQEAAATWFGPRELTEIEAVARAMTLANLTVSSAGALRSRLLVAR
jgi:AhpD family alkylhydroperoxidase